MREQVANNNDLAWVNEFNRKPAHTVPNWQAPASTEKKEPAIEEPQVEEQRPGLVAGWYTGENSGGVPRTTAAVVRRVSGGRLHQGKRAVRRVPSSACVLLVRTPHGRRQSASQHLLEGSA